MLCTIQECDALRSANEVQQASHDTLLASHGRLLASNTITRAVQTVWQEQNMKLMERYVLKKWGDADLFYLQSMSLVSVQRKRTAPN